MESGMEKTPDAGENMGDGMNPSDFISGVIGGQVSGELTLYPVLVALSVAVFCAFASETIIWYLIYRHEDYKKLTSDYEEANEKVDQMREKLMYSAGT